MERNSGTSWSDQWDYNNNQDQVSLQSRKSSNGGGMKAKVGEGLEKTKAVASVGFKKVKEGTSVGFHWVKDKYHKTTQKH